MVTSKIWAVIRRRRHERHLLFALAFDNRLNGLDYHEAAFEWAPRMHAKKKEINASKTYRPARKHAGLAK